MPQSTWAVVLAAGGGDRFGAPKQFARLGGRRLVDWAVAAAAGACDAVVVVLPPGWRWAGDTKVAAAVAGGATRAASVRAGLAAVPASADVVVVHDAAHPLATPELIRSVVEAVTNGTADVPGAVLTLPLTETLKRVAAGVVTETLDRSGLHLAQTPYAFRADVLRAAYAAADEAIEDSELVERLGERVVAVPGDPRNIHVATQADLEVAERLLRR